MDEYERLKKKRSLYRRSATNLEKRMNEALKGDEEANTKVLKKYVAALKEAQGTLTNERTNYEYSYWMKHFNF